MAFSTVHIQDCRNITSLRFDCVPQFNIFYGPNGSGKTSVLEAIHCLCLGASFRSLQNQPIIQSKQDCMTVFGKTDAGDKIGVEKRRAGESRVHINHEPQANRAELARLNPVLVLDSQRFELIDGGPSQRRKFIDWGLFHVEQAEFYSSWRHYQRALSQRNHLLRIQAPLAELNPWDELLCQHGEIINSLREAYVIKLGEVFQSYWTQWLPGLEVSLCYKPGWKAGLSLQEAQKLSMDSDKARGFTQVGPHRAELSLSTPQGAASQILSRGQKKMLLFGLNLAQGSNLYQAKQQICTYLIDDLAAELDNSHRELMIQTLLEINAQSFITSIEKSTLAPLGAGYVHMLEHSGYCTA